jgi:hypothetical protein
MRERNLDNIPQGTCVCSECGERQDNTEYQFYSNRFTKDGYRLRVNTYCRTCSTRISKELSQIKRKVKNQYPQPAYGESCAICNKAVYKHKSEVPTGVDGTWGWQCDHDHETNEFRGWLCKKCNTGLGALGDNLESLLRAVEYLNGKT